MLRTALFGDEGLGLLGNLLCGPPLGLAEGGLGLGQHEGVLLGELGGVGLADGPIAEGHGNPRARVLGGGGGSADVCTDVRLHQPGAGERRPT